MSTAKTTVSSAPVRANSAKRRPEAGKRESTTAPVLTMEENDKSPNDVLKSPKNNPDKNNIDLKTPNIDIGNKPPLKGTSSASPPANSNSSLDVNGKTPLKVSKSSSPPKKPTPSSDTKVPKPTVTSPTRPTPTTTTSKNTAQKPNGKAATTPSKPAASPHLNIQANSAEQPNGSPHLLRHSARERIAITAELPNLPDSKPIRGVDPADAVVALTQESKEEPTVIAFGSDMPKREGICKDIGGAIGHTPLVYLNNITKGLPAKIAVKLEYMNPAGSVKDRVGFAMIEDAEKKGLITPGVTTLVEPTSGNMGIALAFCAKLKGYKLVLCMPSSMSVERRAVLQAYDAEVILTDPTEAVKEARQRAREIAAALPNFHLLDQFGNPANVDAHYMTSGPEVWEQTDGKVDIVVYGVGSGGTVSGVGKYLKEKKPSVEVYAVEPHESSVINGLTHSPHKIQGMGTGFIPEILDRSLIKEALRVHSDDAIAMAKRLATEESILGGISSGANVVAAIELAKRPENAGKLIVTNINSFGERYLSTVLYNDIKEEVEKRQIQTLEESLEAVRKYLAKN